MDAPVRRRSRRWPPPPGCSSPTTDIAAHGDGLREALLALLEPGARRLAMSRAPPSASPTVDATGPRASPSRWPWPGTGRRRCAPPAPAAGRRGPVERRRSSSRTGPAGALAADARAGGRAAPPTASRPPPALAAPAGPAGGLPPPGALGGRAPRRGTCCLGAAAGLRRRTTPAGTLGGVPAPVRPAAPRPPPGLGRLRRPGRWWTGPPGTGRSWWARCRCSPPSSTRPSTPAPTPRRAGCSGTSSTSTSRRCPSSRRPPGPGLQASGAWRAAGEAVRDADLVDYREAGALVHAVLEALAEPPSPARAPGATPSTPSCRAHPEVEDYARFRRRSRARAAASEPARGDARRRVPGRRATRPPAPPPLRPVRPRRAAEGLAGRARDAGTGLYLDLPLGVHPDGYDVWRERDLFALGLSAGAPPDPFFTGGQNWGFPPLHPARSRADRPRLPAGLPPRTTCATPAACASTT